MVDKNKYRNATQLMKFLAMVGKNIYQNAPQFTVSPDNTSNMAAEILESTNNGNVLCEVEVSFVEEGFDAAHNEYSIVIDGNKTSISADSVDRVFVILDGELKGISTDKAITYFEMVSILKNNQDD